MAHVTLKRGYTCFEVSSYDQCGRRLDIANAIKVLIFNSCYKSQYERGKGEGEKDRRTEVFERQRPILLTRGLCASADDKICSQRARRKWRDLLEHHKKVPQMTDSPLLQEWCVESVSSDSCSVIAQRRIWQPGKNVRWEWETHTSPKMPMVDDIGNIWNPG